MIERTRSDTVANDFVLDMKMHAGVWGLRADREVFPGEDGFRSARFCAAHYLKDEPASLNWGVTLFRGDDSDPVRVGYFLYEKQYFIDRGRGAKLVDAEEAVAVFANLAGHVASYAMVRIADL